MPLQHMGKVYDMWHSAIGGALLLTLGGVSLGLPSHWLSFPLFLEMEPHTTTKAGVQWHNLSLLQPLPPGFK